MLPTYSAVTQNQDPGGTATHASSPWLDAHLNPFQSRFVEIDGNRLQYIDEGSGPLLFFLHPGIGWSFIYRDIIKELRSRFRCVALDLPGFGSTRLWIYPALASPSQEPSIAIR